MRYVRDGHIVMGMKTGKPLAPLTPAVFYILLALVERRRLLPCPALEQGL